MIAKRGADNGPSRRWICLIVPASRVAVPSAPQLIAAPASAARVSSSWEAAAGKEVDPPRDRPRPCDAHH
jgi:hypothetical protein